MRSIFISYRREDSQAVTERIYDHLTRSFARSQVFKDVDNIPPGVDFRTHLGNAVNACKVLLVVMGPQWLSAADRNAKRRLDDPDDFVRVEIVAALERNVTVVPVLVGGAAMPAADQLPPPLRKLAYINAVPVRPDPDFTGDFQRLRRAVQKAVGRPAALPLTIAAVVVVAAGALAWWVLSSPGPEPILQSAPSGPCREVPFMDTTTVPPTTKMRKICD